MNLSRARAHSHNPKRRIISYAQRSISKASLENPRIKSGSKIIAVRTIRFPHRSGINNKVGIRHPPKKREPGDST